MHLEYEEFDSIQDIFMYMSSAAPPMKNTMPIHSYKGYIMSFVPLSAVNDTFLVVYTKGTLEPGIYEFDISSNTFKKVTAIERADKNYFIAMTPKRNTLADAALEKL